MLVKSGVRTTIRAVLVTVLAVPLLVSTVSVPAFAETSASTNVLKISPVRRDIQINPGQSQTVDVTVSNLTDADITVRPIENDFTAGDEKGTPALILDQDEFAKTHSLKRFMVPLADVIIPAKKAKTVEVTIRVPADAQAGGYFGALRFAPTSPGGDQQVNLSASVASLILLTVPGDTVQKLTLTDFQIQQDGKSGTNFRTPKNLQVTFRFQNEGNIQLGPFGKISVTQGDKVVFENDFNSDEPRDVVLPDSARRWDIPLENIGEFGFYTVQATLTYGDNNQTVEATKTFWVIPTLYIIIAIATVVVLIGAIILVIVLIRKKRKSRQNYRRR